MKLYLLRHGQYATETESLNFAGKREVEAIAEFLLKEQAVIERIYSSPKARAQETAKIIQQKVAANVSIEIRNDLNPNDPVEGFMEDLSKEKKVVLIAGHMPFLGTLAMKLLAYDEAQNAVGFQTGSLAILDRDSKGNWKLVSLINPSSLR